MSDNEKKEDAIAPVRGRGRPKGTGGNKRPDCQIQVNSGDNRKYLEHSMAMWDWPKVNMKQPKEVSDRIIDYFSHCADDDMKPSVAGMALAFGVSRKTLWQWVNGLESAYIPAESRNLLKKGYQILTAQMENYMQNGKINPVAGIFLMKNNMDYKDQQEMVLMPNNQFGEQASPEELQEKYLEVTASDYDVED